jgi:Fe-S cluster assembly protein SufD
MARLPEIDGRHLVFVDGRYRADLSDVALTGLAGPGVSVFSQVPSFGRLAAGDNQLAALNTMLTEDGAVIAVPEGVDAGTIVIASLATDVHGRPVAFHPRHSISLARGARLTVVEVAIGEGVYLHNPVSEITVGADAHLTHVRLQDEATDAFHLAVIYADVAARGTYDSFSLVLGGRLTRTEIHARLGGAGGMVHLNAAQLLRGVQHADFTTVVAHDAPSCASRQTVKNVLAGHARGVFQGRIEVARIAQKTDGYQMNQALLLSPDAEIDSKPELEIFADDVKCSHGATVGELDAEQLFYLRSRGVPEDEARSILVRAFLAEAMAGITHEQARAALERAVEASWKQTL